MDKKIGGKELRKVGKHKPFSNFLVQRKEISGCLKLWKRMFIFGAIIVLEKLMFDELRNACRPGNRNSWRIFVWYYFLTNFTCIILNCKINFFEGVKQIANVAALSGIV